MNLMNEEKLLSYMEEKHLDGFFVSKKENVRYISGYTGDDSYLFITNSAYFFLTDPRYTEQAAAECPQYKVVNWRKPGRTIGDTVGELMEENGLSTLAFEADNMNFADYQIFSQAIKGELVPEIGVIEKMRQIKNKQEIEYQKAACEISCRALEKLLPEIRVGVTEKELAAKLSLYMVMEGADTMPYGNILISGARTSLLHGIPSEKAIEYGDFVLMDFGCQVHGYMSDMTRTVVVGKATDKQKEVYELEKKMVEDSLAVTKAGVTGREIYRASLKALEGTEYMGYQYTNIGHGIGLFVHEGPFSSESDQTPLLSGNVRTIEPGIYIPSWGGVRIEDQILVTEDGYENMVRFTHDLIEL
ncbi:aminopeptidase P family protein [Clostridium sp. D2Q-14]|nr:aminopeptidase P family protein [Anaeromonas gelatinilytica]